MFRGEPQSATFTDTTPFTGKPVTDESLMSDQFVNTTDVRKKHYKNSTATIPDAKKYWAC